MALSQQNVIKQFMKSLDTTKSSGTTALNAAIKAACSGSNVSFTTISSVIDQMISDCQKASSADDFLKTYCGINLDNNDTGAITGYDAGGSSVEKTAESIVPEVGSLNTYFNDSSFTKNGLTFRLVRYDDDDDYYYHYSNTTVSSLTENQKFMWRALYTWWAEESLDLITASYGNNFGFTSSSSASVKTIHVGFTYEDNDALAWVSNWSGDGVAVDLDLVINMRYYGNVDTSNPNGYTTTAGAGYLDRTIAHEFTHASMAANITNFNKLPLFIKEGMAELTHGIDDERSYDIRVLASNPSMLRNALNVNVTSDGSGYEYAGGFMFLRYLAKQLENTSGGSSGGGGGSSTKFTSGNDYYEGSVSNTVLSALGGNDTIYSYGSNVRINGDAGNDSIFVAGNKNTVNGGAGNDYVYLYGNSSNIIVNGDAGNDEIHSGSTTATIKGGAGNDYVLLYANASNTKVYGDAGKDSLLSGAQKSTLSGGAGNDYFYIYTNGVNNKIVGGAGNDTVYDGGTQTFITGDDGNDYIYLYANATKTTVNGGAGKDSILSGASNSSLSGGAGNDYIHLFSQASNTTVNGGAGNDTIRSYSSYGVTYVYKTGDGNDVIYGFDSSNDRIRITQGTVKSYYYKSSDVVFRVGSGTITVKNGRGKSISIIGSNGKTRTYSTSSATTLLDNYFAVTADNASMEYSNADIYGSSAEECSTTGNSDFYDDHSLVSEGVADTWFTEDDNHFETGDTSDIGSITKYTYVNPPSELGVSDNLEKLQQIDSPVLAYSENNK